MARHRHRRPVRALVLAAATLALAATPASAMPIDPPVTGHHQNLARPDTDPGSVPQSYTDEERQAIASRGVGAPRPVQITANPTRVVTSDPGFDWASAAIGGAGAVLIVALASLGVSAVGGRRQLRTAR